jgi:hypothetical protein
VGWRWKDSLLVRDEYEDGDPTDDEMKQNERARFS